MNLRRNLKSSIPDTIAHECEHGFIQHANIHRAGLVDMRSENPASRRFFDGIVERFKPIKQGTVEYEQAQVYAHEFKSYNNIYFPDGRLNTQVYGALNCEKDAFKAGGSEKQLFNQCRKDFVKNFSLFNLNL